MPYKVLKVILMKMSNRPFYGSEIVVILGLMWNLNGRLLVKNDLFDYLQIKSVSPN
jgi:hypothetical protein